jgi:hypothetical protein
MREKYRTIRQTAYEQGKQEFDELARDRTFRDFVILYIAEGYRRTRNSVSLANSDPAVITIAARWIERLTTNQVRYVIHHHADQDVAGLRRFWSDHLGIDPARIRFQPKTNSNRLRVKTWRCRYGVLAVCTCDTSFRARLEGVDAAGEGRVARLAGSGA